MKTDPQVETIVIPKVGYVLESSVRQLFHPNEKGQAAFEKAFRGCTMVVDDDGAYWMPVDDLRDHLTHGKVLD